MLFPEGLLVVVACTLSGGVERVEPAPVNASCRREGTGWAECSVLDEAVQQGHVVVPWAVTLGTLVFLSMPTLLLRSRHKEKALGVVAWNFLQCLGLVACSCLATDHPSICFVLTMHSCVLLLAHMEVSPTLLVGPRWWWALRYLSMFGLLAWQVVLGPAVSVVRWPSTPPGSAVSCAYLAHLGGVLAPVWVLSSLRTLHWIGRSVLVWECRS